MEKQRITTFDRTAICMIVAMGVLVGSLLACTTDLRPSSGLYIIFPGFVTAQFMYEGFGLNATIIGCGLVNGAAYGLMAYGFCRFADSLKTRLPEWSSNLGRWLSRRK